MPAPTTVTAEQVTQAAATLTEQGKPITGWTLRGVIGSGRPNRLLSVWREQQGMLVQEDEQPKADDLMHSETPPEDLLALAGEWSVDIGRIVDRVTRIAWTQASALASRFHLEQVCMLRSRVGDLERELEYASQQVGSMEDLSTKRWLEMSETLRVAARQVEVAQQDMAQAREEAEAHRDSNVRLQVTLDEMVRRMPVIRQSKVS